MYFFTSEERQKLRRGLFPQTRELEISDELRGWNWNQVPLKPVYDDKLAIHEVAGKYCPTSRDLYLQRVRGLKTGWNQAMIQGKILHDTVANLLTQAKKLIYFHGVNGQSMIREELSEVEFGSLKNWETRLDEDFYLQLRDQIKLMWQFEADKLLVRLQEVLSKQPYIGVDSLANLVIPVIVEQKLDGSFLGLSSKLSTDAFKTYESMILDLKFGKPRDFHKLTITGYALVMEAIYSVPINVGCLVYPKFKDGRIIIEKDFQIIDEQLRQWFIEERDQKMRMVAEEIAPKVADNCYSNCPYYTDCH